MKQRSPALAFFGLVCAVWRSSHALQSIVSRRAVFSAGASSIALVLRSNPALALSPDPSSLLSLIPPMRFGAPATNATIPQDLALKIETLAASLEALSTHNNAQSPLLNGSWRLVYSNGPEITSLAAKLPLGFCLGKTFQPLDTSAGFFENGASIEHVFHLAKLQTNVVGDVRIAKPGSLNAAGVLNDKGNRVDVNFRIITFQLDEIVGMPVLIRKAFTPKVNREAAQPANDITYLDKTMRIVRGGEGSLFIFERDQSADTAPMLTVAERNVLFGASGADVAVGSVGTAKMSTSPELQFLFQGEK